jgi:hypothetical protein
VNRWARLPGSKGKDHDVHFCPDLSAVLASNQEQSDRTERTEIIVKPGPGKAMLDSLDRLWNRSRLRAPDLRVTRGLLMRCRTYGVSVLDAENPAATCFASKCVIK